MNDLLKENVGFFFEIMLFFLSGVFFVYSMIISVALFSIGLALAIYVGGLIKKNALAK